MIKVDPVNAVSTLAALTKVKAEVAVDAIFEAMRLSMQRGEACPRLSLTCLAPAAAGHLDKESFRRYGSTHRR